jgi:predicted alpha/beta-hydrolase family hydrolase
MEPDLHFDGPPDAARTLVLAHGAGAGMRTPFLDYFAAGLAGEGLRVARFEFPYMASYTQSGKKRPPDREPVLRETWLRVIQRLGPEGLVIGGKSMGGRIASLVADESGVAGLACLGYPFHPVGKPKRLRVEHLETIKTPTLIVQGTRDPFGTRDEVAEYRLARSVKIHWCEDGDHSLTPRKSSGRSGHENWDEAIRALAAFAGNLKPA